MNPLKLTEGYRTYIMAACGAVTILAFFVGLIDVTTAQMLLGLFGCGGMAALRAAK